MANALTHCDTRCISNSAAHRDSGDIPNAFANGNTGCHTDPSVSAGIHYPRVANAAASGDTAAYRHPSTHGYACAGTVSTNDSGFRNNFRIILYHSGIHSKLDVGWSSLGLLRVSVVVLEHDSLRMEVAGKQKSHRFSGEFQ